MATIRKGVNRTLADSPTGQNLLGAGLFGGKLRVMIDTYAMSDGTAETALETVAMGDKLPIGAKVVEVILHTEDLSNATLTIDVGDSVLVDRYIDGTDCTGVITAKMAAADTGRGFTVTLATHQQILVTFATLTGGDPIDDALITLIVLYVVE